MTTTREKFTEFKQRDGAIPDTELDDFWSALAPATIDGMLGEWRGGEFVTGHKDGVGRYYYFYLERV